MDDNDNSEEKKLLPHAANEDIYGALLFSVLEVTKLPKELQVIIAGYVDFTTALLCGLPHVRDQDGR